MGNIRTSFVKRLAKELIETHKGVFTTDFDLSLIHILKPLKTLKKCLRMLKYLPVQLMVEDSFILSFFNDSPLYARAQAPLPVNLFLRLHREKSRFFLIFSKYAALWSANGSFIIPFSLSLIHI